jgi:hypothetical protein
MTTPDYRAALAELVEAVYADGRFWEENLYEVANRARTLLAAPEAMGVADEEDAAFAMGQTGGQPSEAERLAFEQWMRGHSWLVSGEWNGSTYDDRPGREGWHDNNTMITRMLWAAWRDRAALSPYGTAHPAPVPVGERLPGEGDLDVEGTCWVWNFTAYTWGLFRLDLTAHSHWLPHWALPLPEVT